MLYSLDSVFEKEIPAKRSFLAKYPIASVRTAAARCTVRELVQAFGENKADPFKFRSVRGSTIMQYDTRILLVKSVSQRIRILARKGWLPHVWIFRRRRYIARGALDVIFPFYTVREVMAIQSVILEVTAAKEKITDNIKDLLFFHLKKARELDFNEGVLE